MERNYIDWNISNWITVILMFGIAFLVINLAAIGWQGVTGTAKNETA